MSPWDISDGFKKVTPLLAATSIFFSGCATMQAPVSKGSCRNEVERAAVKMLVGEPAKSEYRILNTKYYGLGVEKLGNMRLHLYTVEIADEADGGVMVAFVNEKICRVHDVRFGTFALSR